MTGTNPTVLIVDDDADVLDVYERYLADDYDVETATTGEEAMAEIGPDCRIVILDRRLPDVPGSEVLERIRDREIDARVAMVTAVEPDFDIIDMEFDDYLVKPVDERRFVRTVDHLRTRLECSRLLDEYYRTANKIATLEIAKPREHLAENDRFAELQARADSLQERVTETLIELDDYASAFHEVERIPNVPGPE